MSATTSLTKNKNQIFTNPCLIAFLCFEYDYAVHHMLFSLPLRKQLKYRIGMWSIMKGKGA